MIRALLTIDDLASKNTPALLDYLKEKGITPLLFGVGEALEVNRKEAEYALRCGFIIGNHSYSHPFFSELTMDEAVEEINRCEAVLDKLYHDCCVERRYRPFRFPYGDKGGKNKDALQAYLREKGFDKVDDRALAYPFWDAKGYRTDIDTFWSFDIEEYRIRKGSGFTLESVMEKIHDPQPEEGAALLAEGNSHIILFHAHDDTDEMVPRYYEKIIGHLIECGVKFDGPRFLPKD